MSEDKYAHAPDKASPPPPDAKYASPAPKAKHSRKPVGDNRGSGLAKTSPATAAPAAPQVMNPSYVNALHRLDTYFRQQGQLAALLGKAADDGLAEFKIRSSHDYNKSSNWMVEVFKLALAAAPLVKTAFEELQTGARLVGLARKVRAMESLEAGVHAMTSLKETLEPIKEVHELGEATSDVGEAAHAGSEARRAGDFEIATIESLTQLDATEVATLWRREEFMDALMPAMQFTPAKIDLLKLVEDIVGRLPDPGTLSTELTRAAVAFEVELYFRFYLEEGGVTYVTTEREDVTIREFQGMPNAVVERLRATNNLDRVLAHPKLKHEHRVHRFEGMKV